MPCLVVSDRAFLIIGEDLRLALQTTDNTVDGVHEVLFADFLMFITGSDECSLVADISDVGTGESRCLLG